MIFSIHEMKYLWYVPKQVKFHFILYFSGHFFLAISRPFPLVQRVNEYNIIIGFKHNLHLENGLEYHFKE